MGSSTWESIKGMVASAAPALGTALGGPAGGAVGSMIAGALGVEDSPDAVAQAMKTDPEAAAKLQRIQNEHERELRSMVLEAETSRLSQINKTMRAELAHDGVFKSGWRPAIGWVLALTIGALMASLVYAIFTNPSKAPDIIDSATVIISLMMVVLGVSVKKRSDDKAVSQGMVPRGIGDILSGALGKGK